MADITLTVKRTGAGGEAGPGWQSFTVPEIAETMSVLDALIWVQQNSDPTLAFRRACRVKMCGTCGVVINGREGLACGTLVRSLVGARGGEVRVEPMRHVPVVRDLVTDPGIFYQHLAGAGAAFFAKEDVQEPAVILPDSKERKTIKPPPGMHLLRPVLLGVFRGWAGLGFPGSGGLEPGLCSGVRHPGRRRETAVAGGRRRAGCMAVPYDFRMHGSLPQGDPHHRGH